MNTTRIESDSAATSPASANMPIMEPRVIIPSRKRRKQGDLIGETLINIERDKLKLLQEKRMRLENSTALDEDRHFFESIMPHIQKMDPLTKLQFRSEVHQLVIRYSYNNTSSQTSARSSQVSETSFSQHSPSHLLQYREQYQQQMHEQEDSLPQFHNL